MCGLSRHEAGLEGQHWHRKIASWADPLGLYRGMTRSCTHTGVTSKDVTVFPIVISSGSGGQRQQDEFKPLHVTFTHVRMPPAAWLSM